MRTRIFLVVDARRVRRMMKRKPSGLHPWERCITLDIVVPNSAFDSPPLVASLEVPEGHIQRPAVQIQSVEAS